MLVQKVWDLKNMELWCHLMSLINMQQTLHVALISLMNMQQTAQSLILKSSQGFALSGGQSLGCL